MKAFAVRKVPGARQVSMKETRELSKLPWVRDAGLSDRTFEARVLPDGRVLLVLRVEGSGTLYPSREALERLVRDVQAAVAEGPVDPAKALLPPIDDFLRDVEAHARSLSKVVRVPEEALDRTLESLDPVYKGVLRLRRAKRMTPEVFTPLTAYVGEVMRGICGGRWTRMPATRKQEVPVYDPEQWAFWEAAQPALRAVAEQAAADVKARGGSEAKAQMAFHTSLMEASMRGPRPIRIDAVEVPDPGHENEPAIEARDGRLFQPVAVIVKEIMEHGAQGSLHAGVSGRLAGYMQKKTRSTG